MKEDFIKEGMWSLSVDLKGEIYGRLIYTKLSGVVLELRGKFDVYRIQNLKQITLYGLVDHFNKKITLMGCDPIRFGNSYIDFRVNSCLIGEHVDVTDGLKIKTANFEYFGLQEFIGKSGLSTKKNDYWDISINYKYQPAIDIKLDKVMIRIQNWLSRKHLTDRGKTGNMDILLKEFIQIKYDFDYTVDLMTVFNESSQFTFLLSLLSNNVIFPLNIDLTLENGMNVTYYYQNPYFKNEYNNWDHNIVKLEEADMAVLVPKLYSMKDQLLTFINYKRTADLYHNHYDENRFLDSLVILETYHRLFCDNSIDTDFQETIDKLMNSGLIPSEHTKHFESLRRREKPNNQKYLELYNTIGKQCQDLISSDIKKYCRSLTDSRNAYTHNDRNRSNLLRDEYMANATENNEALIKYLLLMKLGIDQSTLDKNFENEFRKVEYK